VLTPNGSFSGFADIIISFRHQRVLVAGRWILPLYFTLYVHYTMVVSASVPCVVYNRCQSSTLTRLAQMVVLCSTCTMNGVVIHAMIQARPLSRALLSSSPSSRFSRRSASFHAGGALHLQRGGWMRQVPPRGWDGSRSICRNSSSSSSSSSSTWTASASSNNKIDEHEKNDARSFLGEIETTVHNVLSHYHNENGTVDMQDLPATVREAVGVAKHLDQRLANARRNNDCRTCWLQRAHCICRDCPPGVRRDKVDSTDDSRPPSTNSNRVARLRRLFLVYHHKEICLAVDTAKLLASTLYSNEYSDDDEYASHPSQVRVVVGGIPAEFQESMRELEEAVQGRQQQQAGGGSSCLVLFPDDTARTWKEFQVEQQKQQQPIRNNDDSDQNNDSNENVTETNTDYDVIVLDGTWEQARKLYRRYVPDEESGGPYRIQLELEALERIVTGASGSSSGEEEDGNSDSASGTGTGRQLRRHPVLWREIGTTAATGSLLQDMDPDGPWETILAQYQQRADAGARAQLGAPRMRLREQKTKRS
jgi:DTW domain-containing protein YfiP